MKKISIENYKKLNEVEKMDMYMDFLIETRGNGTIVYPNTIQGLSDCFEDDVMECLKNTLYNENYKKEDPLFIIHNGELKTMVVLECLSVYDYDSFWSFIKYILNGGC